MPFGRGRRQRSFFFVEKIDRPERCRLNLQFGVDLGINRAVHRHFNRRPDNGGTVAAHQHAVALAHGLRQRLAKPGIANQQIGVATAIANFKQCRATAQKTAHVKNWPQPLARDAKWNHALRMAVHHRHHVWARLVNFAVDEALKVRAFVRRHRQIAVEVIHQDVTGSHQPRRAVARQ